MNAHGRRSRGLFITLEGGDGVGKTTQLELLREHLHHRGHTVVVSSEPEGTPLGAAVAQWLRGRAGEAPTDRAEALLFMAARAQHVETVIQPALERGETVLCSRFSHSTLAYQCYGLGLDLQAVRLADAFARDGAWPDLVLLLDAPLETARRRRVGRTDEDRIEARAAAFAGRVRQGFLELAAAEPERVRVVDAAAAPEAVQVALREALEPWL
jgi:dTMP kinase